MSTDHHLSVGVGALVIDAQGRLLLTARVKQPDVWTLPSGYIEGNETIYQTIQREVQEEVSISIRPTSVIGLRERLNDHEKNNLWIVLLAEHISGEIHPDLKEISRASFFRLQDALHMQLTPVTLDLLKRLQNKDLHQLYFQPNLSKEDYLFFS